MKKRWMALALLAALTVTLAVPALADEIGGTAGDGTQAAASAESETKGDTSPAGPDGAETAYTPDQVGFVSFANVENRMRTENLKILALERNIASLEDIDYDKIKKDLQEAVSDLFDAQAGIRQMQMMEPLGASLALSNMETQLDALNDQLKDIRSGKLQSDNQGVIRQLKNAQDQIVLAAESTFVALKAMETQESALERQLAALNRTVEEMELRYSMGQISTLQLSEVKAGRTSLISGLSTLQMNMQVYKSQLEQLLGAEITGNITLGQVPSVTAEQIAAMDLEADMAAYKSASYTLYDAEQTLADAKEQYEDDKKEYKADEKKQEYRTALRTWEAAQFTYNDTVQSCELKFRTLYAQVKDYLQIYQAAQTSLGFQQASYQASELKYEQGTISHNALLTAGDDLRTAEEKVENAMSDLFSAYNTYCWAVRSGILN